MIVAFTRAVSEWFSYFQQQFFSFEIAKGHAVIEALLQHYGFPTRLLDWTTEPLIAMHFATPINQRGTAAIFVLPIDRALGKKLTITLPPPIFERLFVQRGVFVPLDPGEGHDIERLCAKITFAFPPWLPHPVSGEVKRVGLLPLTGWMEGLCRLARELLASDIDVRTDEELYKIMLLGANEWHFQDHDLLIYELFFGSDIAEFLMSFGLLSQDLRLPIKRALIERLTFDNPLLMLHLLRGIEAALAEDASTVHVAYRRIAELIRRYGLA